MSAREWLRLVLVGLGTSVVPLDTAVNIAFPDITHSFGLPIRMIQWVVICYVLTYASLMLAFGRVGDMFGHARVFRTGLVWSVAAFLLCAAAPAYGWLLFFRFLQGIGAGLVISVAPALVTGLFPEQRRSRAVAAFTMIFALGSAAGPLIGGALVSLWGWPAVFWFRAPIALTALLFVRGLPAPPRTGGARAARHRSAPFCWRWRSAACCCFVNELPRLDRQGWLACRCCSSWRSSRLAAFVRREARVAAPIVDLEFFRSLGFAVVNLASVLIYLTSFAVLLFVPYYLVRFTGLPLPVAGRGAGRLLCRDDRRIAARRAADRAHSGRPRRPARRGAGRRRACLVGGWDGGAGHTAGDPVRARAARVWRGSVSGRLYGRGAWRRSRRAHRGVAGSVAMLTRTLGIVGGATLLTLGFHAIETLERSPAGRAPIGAFLAAFHATFRLAGAVLGR